MGSLALSQTERMALDAEGEILERDVKTAQGRYRAALAVVCSSHRGSIPDGLEVTYSAAHGALVWRDAEPEPVAELLEEQEE